MKHETREVDFKLMKVMSSAFAENGLIPSKYTCDGANINPPVDLEHIPGKTKSLAIIVDDLDAPRGSWVHWVMWNIPVTHHIKENQANGMQGTNDFDKHTYCGPCPPCETHRYFFKIYALDCLLNLPVTATKQNLEEAMCDHILAFGELVGLYSGK